MRAEGAPRAPHPPRRYRLPRRRTTPASEVDSVSTVAFVRKTILQVMLLQATEVAALRRGPCSRPKPVTVFRSAGLDGPNDCWLHSHDTLSSRCLTLLGRSTERFAHMDQTTERFMGSLRSRDIRWPPFLPPHVREASMRDAWDGHPQPGCQSRLTFHI